MVFLVNELRNGTNRGGVREPRELIQPDYGACLSCVTTNILYINNLINENWSVADTDALLGREAGETLPGEAAEIYLLDNGFMASEVGPFNTERFIAEGRDYLREYYGDLWPEPDFGTYWTDEKLRERQQIRRDISEAFRKYGDSFVEKHEVPTLETIDEMLCDNYQVIANIVGSSHGVVHASLVYGTTDDGLRYKMYCPRKESGGIEIWSKSKFTRFWRPDEGITGVKLPLFYQ